MNKRVFFIVQNNSELLIAKGFINNLKDDIDEFNIFLIESFRLKNEEVEKISNNITKVNFIPYTKNILNILKLKRRLVRILSNLNITKKDVLFSPSLHDLANIIIFNNLFHNSLIFNRRVIIIPSIKKSIFTTTNLIFFPNCFN